MNTMSEARDSGSLLPRLGHELARDFLKGSSRLTRPRQTLNDQIHAARASSAVLVADRQNTGCHRGRQRLTISRRGEPRGRAGRRTGAMVRDANEDGVEDATFARRRHTIVMQQEDQIRECGSLHKLEHVVPSNSEVIRTRIDDRRAPGLHTSVWIITFCRTR